MIEKIKNTLPVLLPLALAISMFYAMGYYDNFNIDIITYLGIDDLLLIFLNKVVILLYIPCFAFVWFMAMLDRKSEYKLSWLDRKIFSRFTYRKLFGLILLLGFITICVLYSLVLKLVIIFVGFIIFTFVVILVFEPFIKSSDWSKFSFGRWFGVLCISGIFFLLPYFTGSFIASKTVGIKVKIKFNDSVTPADTSYIMIGKTKDFIFILSKKDSLSTAYKTADIKSITYLKKSKSK